MNTIDIIESRSSIRAYTDEKLTREELDILKRAALATPTAMNRQSQRYYFITNKEFISEWEQKVAEVIAQTGTPEFRQRMAERKNKVFYNAPLFVAVFIDANGHFSMADAGIACENLAICAKSIGLDSVILGMPQRAFEIPNNIKEKLGADDNLSFGLGIAIGHRAMDKEPHESDDSHVIFYE